MNTQSIPSQFSYLMFHYVTGIPFHADLHGGVYDNLTLWEQIDEGAQYTPAKKWLFIVPITLCVFYPFLEICIIPIRFPRFLASTHYTHYDPWLFAINLSALIFVLLPKLPFVRNIGPLTLVRHSLTNSDIVSSSTGIACASWYRTTHPGLARPSHPPSLLRASQRRLGKMYHQSTSATWIQGYDVAIHASDFFLSRPHPAIYRTSRHGYHVCVAPDT